MSEIQKIQVERDMRRLKRHYEPYLDLEVMADRLLAIKEQVAAALVDVERLMMKYPAPRGHRPRRRDADQRRFKFPTDKQL